VRKKSGLWYGYLSENREMQNKKTFEIADGYWSLLEIVQPTIIGDERTTYERVVTAHADAWELCYERLHLSIEYIRNLKNPHSGGLFKKRRAEWYNFICLPRQMYLLTQPELIKELRIGQRVSVTQPGIVTKETATYKDKENKTTYIS